MGMSITSIIFAVATVVLMVLLIRQRKQIVGICRSAFGQSERKAEVEDEIINLLQERGELSNSDIRTELNISERSVVRYVDELEKEGKVEQVGNTERDVVYKLK